VTIPTLGFIGHGYWGPNLLRNFRELRDCRVKSVADLNPDRLSALAARHPELELHRDHRTLLDDPALDAVVVATNLASHHQVARDALLAGKHVLIEKPVTADPGEALELAELAEARGLVLMVGHTFLFNQAVRDVKRRLEAGEVGRVLYLHTTRTNLGPIREDTNVVWDLASHDVSVFLHLLGEDPATVAAHGGSYLMEEREDVVFLHLTFPSGVIGNIHVSWLDPCKVRRLTVIGDAKMLLFDDMNPLEPIRIFDKGVERRKRYDTFGEFQMVLRDGDILIPKVPLSEPLKNECAAFLEALRTREAIPSDGRFGHRVVRVLAAAETSLAQGGRPVEVA
jgi:predicted dehydrogenase